MKNILPIILVAIVTLGGGFYGGILYQKHVDKNAQPQFGQFTRSANFNGRLRGLNGAANGIVRGEVTAVSGTTVTVKEASGGSKIIVLSSSTSYDKSTTAAASDVVVGQTIMANGTANSDGSVTAETVSINPQSIGGFGTAQVVPIPAQ